MSSQEAIGTPTRASRRRSVSKLADDVVSTPEKCLSQVKRHMELKAESSPLTPSRKNTRAVNSPLVKPSAFPLPAASAVASPMRRTTRSMSQEKEIPTPSLSSYMITRRRSSILESEEENDQKNESISSLSRSRVTASRKSIAVNETISEEVGEDLNNSTDNELELRNRSISKSPNVSTTSPLSMSVDKSHEKTVADMSICSPKSPKHSNGVVKSAEKRKSAVQSVPKETVEDPLQTPLDMNESTNTFTSKITQKKKLSLATPASPVVEKSPMSKKSFSLEDEVFSSAKTPNKSWNESFKSKAGGHIDRIVTPVINRIIETFSPKKSPKADKTVVVSDDESETESDEDRSKENPFVQGECEVNYTAADGDDTMSEDEREYLEQNEVVEKGEILGSDDTDEDEDVDEEEEEDSFIDNDEEIANQYSMDEDEEAIEKEEEASPKKRLSRIIQDSSSESEDDEKENEEKLESPQKVKSPAGKLNESAKVEKFNASLKHETPSKSNKSLTEKMTSASKHTPAVDKTENPQNPTSEKAKKSLIDKKTPAKTDIPEKVASSKKKTPAVAIEIDEYAASSNKSLIDKKTPAKTDIPENVASSKKKTPAITIETDENAASSKKSAKRKHNVEEEPEAVEENRGKKRKLDESLNITVNGQPILSKKRLKMDNSGSEDSSSDGEESDEEMAEEPMDASSEGSESEVTEKKDLHEAVVEKCSDYMSEYNEKKRQREALKRARKAEKLAKKKAEAEAAAKDQSDSSKENSTIKKKKKNKRKIKKTKSVEEAQQPEKEDLGLIAREIAEKRELKRQAKIEKKKLKKQMKSGSGGTASSSVIKEVSQNNNDLSNGKKKLKKQSNIDLPGVKRKFADVMIADIDAVEKPKKKLKMISSVEETALVQKKMPQKNAKNQVEEIKLNSTSSKIRKIVQNPVQVEKTKSKNKKPKKIPEKRLSLPRPVWSSSGIWVEEPRSPYRFTKQKYVSASLDTPETFKVPKLKNKSKSIENMPRMDYRLASVLQKNSDRDGSSKNMKNLMKSKSTRN